MGRAIRERPRVAILAGWVAFAFVLAGMGMGALASRTEARGERDAAAREAAQARTLVRERDAALRDTAEARALVRSSDAALEEKSDDLDAQAPLVRRLKRELAEARAQAARWRKRAQARR